MEIPIFVLIFVLLNNKDMDIDIKIIYDHKWKFYRLNVTDNKGTFTVSRVYDKEYDAEIAAGIMKSMFDKIDDRKDFDLNLFDFNIRATLRIIDSFGKW